MFRKFVLSLLQCVYLVLYYLIQAVSSRNYNTIVTDHFDVHPDSTFQDVTLIVVFLSKEKH